MGVPFCTFWRMWLSSIKLSILVITFSYTYADLAMDWPYDGDVVTYDAENNVFDAFMDAIGNEVFKRGMGPYSELAQSSATEDVDGGKFHVYGRSPKWRNALGKHFRKAHS